MDCFGFIITRHVNSEKTNKYWNRCIRCIRKFYTNKIVVIDDNSNTQFLHADYNYKNVEFVQSEYPGAGELLPYYYFYKNRYFNNAVFIHDSVFIHSRINFENINIPVLPLWHFNYQKSENPENSIRLINSLKNNKDIKEMFISDTINKYEVLNFTKIRWMGVFGTQCFMNHSFILHIQQKYNLFNLLNVIKNRKDRCSLERVMALMFYKEFPQLIRIQSLFGDISLKNYGYSYDDYCNDLNIYKKVKYPFIKVWTGR